MGSIGRRLGNLEETSRQNAVAEIRRAWREMSDEEMALVLGPYYFGREPTAEEAQAADGSRAKLPEDLIARAVGYREGMGDEELGRRMGELLEPVVNSRRWAVLRRLRSAGEGGRV